MENHNVFTLFQINYKNFQMRKLKNIYNYDDLKN
jgi:hypothetical protein